MLSRKLEERKYEENDFVCLFVWIKNEEKKKTNVF